MAVNVPVYVQLKANYWAPACKHVCYSQTSMNRNWHESMEDERMVALVLVKTPFCVNSRIL